MRHCHAAPSSRPSTCKEGGGGGSDGGTRSGSATQGADGARVEEERINLVVCEQRLERLGGWNGAGTAAALLRAAKVDTGKDEVSTAPSRQDLEFLDELEAESRLDTDGGYETDDMSVSAAVQSSLESPRFA